MYMFYATVILMLNYCEWASERLFELLLQEKRLEVTGFHAVQGWSSDL